MTMTCVDCSSILDIPDDCLPNEIISCPDCGMDYVIVRDESGLISIQDLFIEGEDWGE